jgi:hypothetical protein
MINRLHFCPKTYSAVITALSGYLEDRKLVNIISECPQPKLSFAGKVALSEHFKNRMRGGENVLEYGDKEFDLLCTNSHSHEEAPKYKPTHDVHAPIVSRRSLYNSQSSEYNDNELEAV